MPKSLDERPIFYVYVLFDWQGIPRYVGKGRDDRWLDHERLGRSASRIKTKFVRDTCKQLGEIPKIKVRENLLEADAFETEVALIAAIGRLDLLTGPLINMSDGGTGGDFGARIKQVKSLWTDTERAAHAETYRQISLRFWAALTPEQRAEKRAILRKAALEARAQKRLLDPEYETWRAQLIKAAHTTPVGRTKTCCRCKTTDFLPIRTPKRDHSSLACLTFTRRAQRNAPPRMAQSLCRTTQPTRSWRTF